MNISDLNTPHGHAPTEGPPCSACAGTRRLINRNGDGLHALAPGESREITAALTDHPTQVMCYVVQVGEVCPCSLCGAFSDDERGQQQLQEGE